MIEQADSAAVGAVQAEGEAAMETSAPRQQGGWLTPRRVLSWLPKNATPEQQDSMIQLYFKPAPITHWSTQPDTLHLPGHTPGKSFRDVSLPQYYKESFFAKDSLYHPELKGGRPGVAGDPVPYTIAGDNFISSLLLACFVITCVSCARSYSFIVRHIKHFFREQNYGTTVVPETAGELRFQLVLAVQTCVLIALGYFLATSDEGKTTYTIDQNLVIGIYAGVVAAYFLVKTILYTIVNNVFFSHRKNTQWLTSSLFLVAGEGLLVFPAITLMAYFGLSVSTMAVYALIVGFLVKLLTLYKCYSIFFKGKVAFLQIILYFCTLEIIPMLMLGSVLVVIGQYLQINY